MSRNPWAWCARQGRHGRRALSFTVLIVMVRTSRMSAVPPPPPSPHPKMAMCPSAAPSKRVRSVLILVWLHLNTRSTEISPCGFMSTLNPWQPESIQVRTHATRGGTLLMWAQTHVSLVML